MGTLRFKTLHINIFLYYGADAIYIYIYIDMAVFYFVSLINPVRERHHGKFV